MTKISKKSEVLLRHSIAGGLRAARLRRELTQAQLAEQLGMSQARLSEIERGTASLTAELVRLKKAVRDDDQFANDQFPNGVDGTVARLRGK